MNSRSTIATAQYSVTDAYCGLRDRVFQVPTDHPGVQAGQSIGVLIEIGYPQGVVSLLAIGEGTVSLYFSTGGGIIGGGGNENVRTAAKELLESVRKVIDSLEPTVSFPLPRRGHIRVYALLADGVRTTEVSEEEMISPKPHKFSLIFHCAQHVITALRESGT